MTGDWASEADLAVPTPDHYLPLLYVAGARTASEPIVFPVEGVDGDRFRCLPCAWAKPGEAIPLMKGRLRNVQQDRRCIRRIARGRTRLPIGIGFSPSPWLRALPRYSHRGLATLHWLYLGGGARRSGNAEE
jgi:hypothetical protein